MARRFTGKELAVLQVAALGVWNEVGGDVLRMVAEEGGDSIPRAEVIELVLDAGRMTEWIPTRLSEALLKTVVVADLLAKVNAASYQELIAAVRPAFPYSRYGF